MTDSTTQQAESVTQQADPAAQQAENATQSTDLTVQDLNALKTIIDIAIARGTFKYNELVAVGQTATKLTTFLEQIAAQTAQAGA